MWAAERVEVVMVREETLSTVVLLLFAAVVKPHPETYDTRISVSRSTPSGGFLLPAAVQLPDGALRTLRIVLDWKALFPIYRTPFTLRFSRPRRYGESFQFERQLFGGRKRGQVQHLFLLVFRGPAQYGTG